MHNPTGSFKLIIHYIGRRKWSSIVIVTGYLLVNILARLSVATFGITYDLNDNAGIQFPVTVTDFSTSMWMDRGGPRRIDLAKVTNHAMAGLTSVPSEYNLSDLSNHTMLNISGQGLDRKVESDQVTYSYSLKEYQGPEEFSRIEKTLHSSSRCVGRAFYNGSIYEKGENVGSTRNVTSSSPEFIRVLASMYAWYSPATDYLWGMRYVEDDRNFTDPSACVTTYLNNEIYPSYAGQHERNATFYECKTCLTDRNNDPGVGSGLLHGFPAENASYAANVLLRIGPFDRVYSFEDTAMLSVKEYSSQEHSIHFMNRIGALKYKDHGEEWFKLPVPADYELHAARLTARLAILAIIGAQRQLPRMTREHGASEQPFITTILEVKWPRAIAVLTGCLVGQFLVIVVVYWKCKSVLIRDHDSYLSVARLLRTAMNKIKGISAGSGKDLADALAKELKKPSNAAKGPNTDLIYGTRQMSKNGQDWLEVDLWTDVPDGFSKTGYDYD